MILEHRAAEQNALDVNYTNLISCIFFFNVFVCKHSVFNLKTNQNLSVQL